MSYLKQARKDAGMTQAQVAQAAGIERAMYAKIESGTYAHSVSLDTADHIAHALGCSIYTLWSGMLESEADYIRDMRQEREDAIADTKAALLRTADALCS